MFGHNVQGLKFGRKGRDPAKEIAEWNKLKGLIGKPHKSQILSQLVTCDSYSVSTDFMYSLQTMHLLYLQLVIHLGPRSHLKKCLSRPVPLLSPVSPHLVLTPPLLALQSPGPQGKPSVH